MKRKIAIFGATGYIGKSLSFELGKDSSNHLVLFGRNLLKLNDIVSLVECANVTVSTYNEKLDSDFTAIINCTGIGSPSEYKKNPSAIFDATESMDKIILGYLNVNSNCKYINFSSGAAYGLAGVGTIDQDTKSLIDINNITPSSYYSIAKINSEAKHRSMSQYCIVDLRLFSFFSHFINIDDTFLLSEIVNSVLNDTVLKTNNIDIVRDYICLEDLARLIVIIIDKKENVNDVFDVTSLSPVSKFELLKFFNEKYGLIIDVKNSEIENAKGIKNEYYSKSQKLREIGFVPKYTSIAGIEKEMKYLI